MAGSDQQTYRLDQAGTRACDLPLDGRHRSVDCPVSQALVGSSSMHPDHRGACVRLHMHALLSVVHHQFTAPNQPARATSCRETAPCERTQTDTIQGLHAHHLMVELRAFFQLPLLLLCEPRPLLLEFPHLFIIPAAATHVPKSGDIAISTSLQCNPLSQTKILS